MKTTCVRVAVVLLAIACVAVAAPIATVSDYTPKSGRSTGAQVFRIFGCGFRTYSEVTCVWNDRFVSRINVIVSDSLIVCETPAIPKDQFASLPQVVPFKIFFDGNQEDLSVELSPFYFGASTSFVSPLPSFLLSFFSLVCLVCVWLFPLTVLFPLCAGPTLEQFTPSFGHVTGGETFYVAGTVSLHLLLPRR